MRNLNFGPFLLALICLPTFAFSQSASLQARAEQGDAVAQYEMAMADLNFAGTPQNFEQTFTYLRLAGEQGHVDAQFQLAIFLSRKWWSERYKPEEAARLFEGLIERGDADTQYFIGEVRRKGIRMPEVYPQDYVEARRLYELAAAQGHAEAMYMLGILNEFGQGIEQNYEAAEQWFRQAAAQGQEDAKYYLQIIYDCCDPDDPALQSDFVALKAAADQGSAEALYELGLYIGQRVRKAEDSVPAFHWLKLAADAGSADAMHEIGLMYFRGYHYITKDVERAVVIFGEAAELGSDDAAYINGQIYGYENGIEVDVEKAIYYHKLAALRGFVYSQNSLADILFLVGDEDSINESITWYRTAAENGHAEAQAMLADIYMRGEVAYLNYEESRHWATQAARQANSTGQIALAIIYADGLGVEIDMIAAYKWSRISAMRDGNREAQNIVKILRDLLDEDQIAQGQALADTCVNSGYVECGY